MLNAQIASRQPPCETSRPAHSITRADAGRPSDSRSCEARGATSWRGTRSAGAGGMTTSCSADTPRCRHSAACARDRTSQQARLRHVRQFVMGCASSGVTHRRMLDGQASAMGERSDWPQRQKWTMSGMKLFAARRRLRNGRGSHCHPRPRMLADPLVPPVNSPRSAPCRTNVCTWQPRAVRHLASIAA